MTQRVNWSVDRVIPIANNLAVGNKKMLKRKVLIIAVISAAFVAYFPVGHVGARLNPRLTTLQWRADILKASIKIPGCYYAKYPHVIWLHQTCTTPTFVPYGARSGVTERLVSNAFDYQTGSPPASAYLKTVAAQFTTVSTGGESGPFDGTGAMTPNVYSLQINSQFFVTALCGGTPGCSGWEQFVYSNSIHSVLLQYWLVGFKPTTTHKCPAGFGAYYPNCARNALGYASITSSPTPITQLKDLVIQGKTTGALDTATIVRTNGSTTGTATTIAVPNSMGLYTHWKSVEFGIYGDGGSSRATFTGTTTLVAKETLSLSNLAAFPPTCAKTGFTGESNNLYLAPTPVKTPGTAATFTFTERNIPSTLAC